MIDKLKRFFGPKCSAVKINGEMTEFINVPSKPMMFCEAVHHSFNLPIRLNEGNMYCPANWINSGFDNNHMCLNENIVANGNIPAKLNPELLCSIPELQGIRHIDLGLTSCMENECKPDLYIAYVRPENISALMHKMVIKAVCLSVPSNGLLSVCSNVFTNYFIHQTVCLSFGCTESRKYTGVEKDEIVMSIPYLTALQLINDCNI